MNLNELELKVNALASTEGTKEWAMLQMSQGAKVRHESFTSEEYMQAGSIRDIQFEDGCQCSFDEFWYYRTDNCWQQGWSIYTDKVQATEN